jgi:hypothetical protein
MDKAKNPSPTTRRMASNMASPCDARVRRQVDRTLERRDDLDSAADVAHLRI